MKYIPYFLVTTFCIHNTINSMDDEPKQVNTKGIIPLFNQENKANISNFKEIHEAMVHYIQFAFLEMNLEPNSEKHIEQLFCVKSDLKNLRNQCKELGPEQYLEKLLLQRQGYQLDLEEKLIDATDQVLQIDELRLSRAEARNASPHEQ